MYREFNPINKYQPIIATDNNDNYRLVLDSGLAFLAKNAATNLSWRWFTYSEAEC